MWRLSGMEFPAVQCAWYARARSTDALRPPSPSSVVPCFRRLAPLPTPALAVPMVAATLLCVNVLWRPALPWVCAVEPPGGVWMSTGCGSRKPQSAACESDLEYVLGWQGVHTASMESCSSQQGVWVHWAFWAGRHDVALVMMLRHPTPAHDDDHAHCCCRSFCWYEPFPGFWNTYGVCAGGFEGEKTGGGWRAYILTEVLQQTGWEANIDYALLRYRWTPTQSRM